LEEKPAGKGPLAKYRDRWENNIKVDFKKDGRGLDSYSLGTG
jgi:hypothetical protein